MCGNVSSMAIQEQVPQPTFTWSKLTIETLEKEPPNSG